MKNVFIIIILLVLLLGAFFATRFFVGSNPGGFFGIGKSGQVTIKDRTFKVEIADTQEKREIGLSSKNSLSEDQGMLFIFEEPGIHSFWMKDMKFPIDIIFISNNKIVTVYQDVPPPTSGGNLEVYYPTEEIDRVLEISSEASDDKTFTVGDSVNISL